MDSCQRKRILLRFNLLLVVLLSCIQYVDADCSITTPSVYTFGSECQYMCHCKNGESCNTTTGECTSGCDRYWFGPGCQYRDLAENEYTRHASNLVNSPHQYADRGIDGDISTCSYTTQPQYSTVRPWWRVILEDEVTITDIYILTNTDVLQYFREFKITVEKLPYKDKTKHYGQSETSVCYKHDNTTPDSTNIHVTCTSPLIGNQVRITLSEIKSQLIVCDFRINRGRNLAFRQSATSSTIYQNNASSWYLASNAVNGLVYNTNLIECFVTGNFSNKWLQVDFDQLIDVRFFNVTTLTGSDDYIRNYKLYDTTSVKELLHDSGSDTSPATHGYLNKTVQTITIEQTTGDIMVICELELFGDCQVNQCGYDCSVTCHCKSMKSLEHKISGICTSGCEDRWTGENGKCNVECERIKWGTSCQNECGACKQETCDVVTGKCTGGCQDGFNNSDDNCKTECASGRYGYNCQSKCSEHCKNSCDKVNGKCVDGCNPGYSGDTCEQECAAGNFGEDCNDNCSENCDVKCHHVNGSCTSCKAGWKGIFCNTDCDDGSYGVECKERCNDTCLNFCDKINGACTSCRAGWTGYYCKQECTEGMYGPNCIHNCSTQCVDVCAKDNGYCNCTTGWYGDTCHDECEDGSYGDYCREQCGYCKDEIACDKINGTCHKGCDSGFEGSLCASKIVQQPPPDEGFPVAAIAGIVSAVVVIVIIVVILFIVIRRRSGNKNNGYTESTDNTETKWKNVSGNHKKNGSGYYLDKFSLYQSIRFFFILYIRKS